MGCCAHRANSEPDCSKRFVDKNSKVAEPYAGELLSLWSSTVTRHEAKSVQNIMLSCAEVSIVTATEPQRHSIIMARCDADATLLYR